MRSGGQLLERSGADRILVDRLQHGSRERLLPAKPRRGTDWRLGEIAVHAGQKPRELRAHDGSIRIGSQHEIPRLERPVQIIRTEQNNVSFAHRVGPAVDQVSAFSLLHVVDLQTVVPMQPVEVGHDADIVAREDYRQYLSLPRTAPNSASNLNE